MKKYGGARTIKKINKKRTTSLVKFKNTKKNRFQKNLIALVEEQHKDPYSYEKVLRKFEKFFKAIMKLEDKVFEEGTSEDRNMFDIKKLEILDKLKGLDDEHGKLLERIRKYTPDIYKLLKESNNMNINNNDNDIIEDYANILEELRELTKEHYYNRNSKLQSDITLIGSILSNQLIEEFLEKETTNLKVMEDELVDLFKSFAIKKNNANNLSRMFSNIKL